MIFFAVFDTLAVASLCVLVCAFWANSKKVLAVSECLMIAAALAAAAGAVSDERLWIMAGLSGAFALMNIYAVPLLRQESRKKDKKEKGEEEEKEEEK